MPTVKATKAGAWSDTTVWDTGIVPVDGETVDLNGYVVAIDVATIPATGNLAGIGSPAKVGRMTLNLTTRSVTFNVSGGNLAAGGDNLLTVSGGTNTLTINGNIIGGTANVVGILDSITTGAIIVNGGITGGASGAPGWYKTGAAVNSVINDGPVIGSATAINSSAVKIYNGLITINCAVTGGGYTNAYGVWLTGSGSVTINNNISAGSVLQAYGVFHASSGTCTLNTCNMINTVYDVAYVGKAPVWNKDADNYIQFADGTYFAQQLLDHQILASVVNGTVTGNRVDCPVAKAIESSGDYGDPAAPLVGTYHEAAVDEVQDGVMFGAALALEGTYAGGGGGGVFPIIGGSHIIQPARAA